MAGFTGEGKNLMLDALSGTNPTTPITHVGLLSAGAALTSVTSSGDTFTKSSHGLTDGAVVILSSLTGGSGLVAGDPYYVVSSATNTFKLSRTSGGSAVTPSTDVTSTSVTRYTEISGGSPAYARKSIAFASASSGQIDDSTNGAVIDVPGATTVAAVGFYSASTSGSLLAVADVADESFTGQGTYTVTDAKLNLNLA